MRYRDSKKRGMKLEGGSRQWLIIHRFKCCSCGRLHNELPDCLVPYKHYQTEIISGVLDGVCTQDDLECEDYPCADTMLLWLKWFSLNLQRIEGFLRRALYKVSCIKEGFSPDRTSLLETARKNTKRWLEQIIRTIYNSGGRLIPVAGCI